MGVPAVVLLSGGLDSATVLAVARQQGFSTYALSFRYGQRHEHELTAARLVADALGVVEHRLVEIDLRQFGGSSLVGVGEIPRDGLQEGIPSTYVPARNTVFLAFALAWAEVLGSKDIFIGVNAIDYSGYPDCRPAFIAAFEAAANLGTRDGGISIHAPLVHLTKPQIVEWGRALGVDYGLTHSCYDPDESGHGCGQCDACRLRAKAFAQLNLIDPAA